MLWCAPVLILLWHVKISNVGKIFCFLKLLCDSFVLKKIFVGVINRVQLQCMCVLVCACGVSVCERKRKSMGESKRKRGRYITNSVIHAMAKLSWYYAELCITALTDKNLSWLWSQREKIQTHSLTYIATTDSFLKEGSKHQSVCVWKREKKSVCVMSDWGWQSNPHPQGVVCRWRLLTHSHIQKHSGLLMQKHRIYICTDRS